MAKKSSRFGSLNSRSRTKSFRKFETLENRAMMAVNTAPVINNQFTNASTLDAGKGPITTIVATDAESAVTLEIVSGNGDNLFAIDANSGELSLINKPVDFFPMDQILQVKATDDEGLSSTATVTVSFRIQAEVIDGVLVITGTNQDDDFEIMQIQQLPDQYQIVLWYPDGSLQGTGSIVPLRKILVNLRDGNDRLKIGSGVNINDIEINGGEGNDVILLGADHTEAWSNDVRSPGYGFGGYMFVKKSLAIDTGEGNDTIYQRFTYNPADMQITMGEGDDVYDIYGGFVADTPDSTGAMNIDMGTGNDQVKIGYLTCNPAATIELGDDNDLLSLYATQFSRATIFNGGDGADTLALDVNRYDQNLDVDAGAGSDYLLFSRSVFADQVKLVTGLGSDTLLIGKYIEGLNSDNTVNYANGGSSGKNLIVHSDVEEGDGGDADTATIAANSLENLFAEFGDGDDRLSMEHNALAISGVVDGGKGVNRLKVKGASTFVAVNFLTGDDSDKDE